MARIAVITLLVLGAGAAFAETELDGSVIENVEISATVDADGARMDPVRLVSRWAHVIAAIVLLGGSIFMRFVLHPAIGSAFGDDGRKRLRPYLMRRWKLFVHASLAVLLASGLFNYIVVGAPEHRGEGLYHMLFGVKFLMAMALFALVSILVSTRERPSKLREHGALWTAVAVAMGVTIVLISGYMRLL